VHALERLSAWLDHTALSQIVKDNDWIVPTVQTIHILAIAVVFVSALMIDLRSIGLIATDQTVERVSARFLPFVWWPLVVLAATGAVMIVGEPPRSLKNPVFQLKMVLVAAAVGVTFLHHLLARAHAGAARAAAILSILLWTGIIFAGRWIAYYA